MKFFERMSAIAAGTALMVGLSGAAHAAYVAPTAVTWENNGDVDTGRDNVEGVKEQGGDFLSLGRGGWAVMDFGAERTGSGLVIETTYNCTDTPSGECTYGESAKVFAALDWDGTYAATADGANPLGGAMEGSTTTYSGADWTYVAAVPNGDAQTGFTFDIPGPFRFLAIVDTTTGTKSKDGFDIDKVAVTPLPAALWFLVTAIGGLTGVRWLRKGQPATA
ncbi:VPLPA-CTERM sorting domain-containing protein [Roseospira marina]|nr:VPLPA-CTERM sorting domain-containing protein [Roseospira marina]MBB4314355.1 hypothetical protein [Roseospira marina]MBB5087515.1 hypothetical protein [Roseospira marina]